MAWTWTMVSPLLMAKCRISLGTIKKLPTFIVCSLLSSKLSPIPTRKVPFSTVTFSSVGCQCAGILDPSAHRDRRTKGAASAFMSPARSEEHTSELQSHVNLVCRLLLEKKKKIPNIFAASKKKKKQIY